jgi:hypothetical protein
VLFEEGRDLPFPLDQSEKWCNRSGAPKRRNQRTIGKEDFEESECRMKIPVFGLSERRLHSRFSATAEIRKGKATVLDLGLYFVEYRYSFFGKSLIVDVHIKLNDLDSGFNISS